MTLQLINQHEGATPSLKSSNLHISFNKPDFGELKATKQVKSPKTFLFLSFPLSAGLNLEPFFKKTFDLYLIFFNY